MNQERLMNVILSPYLSEKVSIGTANNGLYAFEVKKCATKEDVKQAVKLMFKADVETVRIVNVKTKPKRFGQILGRSKAWKKAYVTLRKGQTIEFVGA